MTSFLNTQYSTQGDLTQIFPTFSIPILNLNFYMNADPKSTYLSNSQQNSIELWTKLRFCHPLLPPGPHFIITLNFMDNFRSKNIFYKTNIEDGQKVPWKSASLISNCIFLQKKHIFFCKMFVIFGVFSNSAAWWQNLRLVHIFLEFFWFFDT